MRSGVPKTLSALSTIYGIDHGEDGNDTGGDILRHESANLFRHLCEQFGGGEAAGGIVNEDDTDGLIGIVTHEVFETLIDGVGAEYAPGEYSHGGGQGQLAGLFLGKQWRTSRKRR